VDDKLFKAAAEKKGKGEADFFALTKTKTVTSDERKKLQDAVDAGVKINATEKLYLKSRFALSKDQKPHEMKF
jgi:hypothetical protein